MQHSVFQPLTLICTLGTQPQIVIFALDYLLGRGEAIDEVLV